MTFIFYSFTLSTAAFCKGCTVEFLSSFALLKLFNSSVCNQIFLSSEIPTRFQTVFRYSWVCFIVNRLHWTYFFYSAIYTPVIPFKRGPTFSCPNVFSSSFGMILDSRVLESYCDFCKFSLLLISQFNIIVNDANDTLTNRFDFIWFWF